MPILLRMMGGVWVLLTLREVVSFLQRLFRQGIHVEILLTDLLYAVMLAGGIGLLMLREWGRWVLLVGSIAFLLLFTGPALLKFQISPVVIRHIIFYGVFIALLLIPQAKAATKK